MQDFGLRKKKSVQNSLDACIVTVNEDYFLDLDFLFLLGSLVFEGLVVSWINLAGSRAVTRTSSMDSA